MDFHQQHQTSADQILREDNRTPSSSSSSPSSPSARQDFSFADNGRSDGDLSLLSGKPVEMTPADEIFFHGHLLPLHLLSHFYHSYSPPRSSTDCLNLPTNDVYLPDYEPATTTTESSSSCSANGNFKAGRSGNRIHSETSPHAGPSDKRETGSKLKPFSMFGLSRQERVLSAFQGDEGRPKEQKRKLRFGLKRTFRRYMRRMARPMLFFRWMRREEDIQLQAQPFTARGTETCSAPASIRTSPRNSGLLDIVKTPALSAAISDSTVEELQAAIQAAIAYCKKSIANEDEQNLQA